MNHCRQRKPDASKEWLSKLPQLAHRLEESLYRSAPSFEAYNDISTLKQRLEQLAINVGIKAKRIQQAAQQQPGGQPSTQQSEEVRNPLEKKKFSSVAARAMAALEDEDDIIELSSDEDEPPSRPVLLTDTSKCQSHAERLQQKWEDMFQCLLMYIEETRKEETANMNDEEKEAWVWNGCISSRYQKLGSWVSNQRQAKKYGTLKSEREARLVSTGVNLEIISRAPVLNLEMIPRKCVFLSVPDTTNGKVQAIAHPLNSTNEKCNHPGGCLYPAIEGIGLCLNHYKPPQAAAQQPNSSNGLLQRKMANARGQGLGLSLLVPLGGSVSRMKNSSAESHRPSHTGRGITQPGNKDCLFGRETWINNHPGNKRYQQIIEENRLIYQVISKNEKKTLRLKIVNDWKANGGRFLSKLTNWMWEDIGDDKAQQYISLALREEDSTLMKAVETEQQQTK